MEYSDELNQTPEQTDPFVGTVLAGKYEMLELLGEGGAGLVYKARHEDLNKIVAVKVLISQLAVKQEVLKRFKQEARVCSQLTHSNIVSVFDFGIADKGDPYLVMEFINGSTLADEIEAQGRIEVKRCLSLFLQSCEALAYAHGKGVVHRDFKPSNMMLTTDEEGRELVKIVDFGLAKALRGEGVSAETLTETGQIFGSPPFMSPEQCMGQVLDSRTDIYSLGCSMYQALTGTIAFLGENPIDTIRKQLATIPPALAIPDCNKRLIDPLDAIVFKALEKDRERRYQTVSELADDLKQLSETGAFKGGATMALSRALRNCYRAIRNHPRLAAVYLLGAVVLAGVLLSVVLLLVPILSFSPAADDIAWVRQAPPVSADPNLSYKERMLKVFLNRAERRAGKNSPQFLEHLQALVNLYQDAGQYSQAADYQANVLSITERQDGSSSLTTADAAKQLADLYYWQDKYAQAARLYESAISMYEYVHGHEEAQLALPLVNFADVLEHLGRRDQARKRFRQAAYIFEHGGVAGGEFAHAFVLSKLADISSRSGSYGNSVALYGRAIELWQKLSNGSPNAAIARYHLARDLERQGRTEDVSSLYSKALPALEEYLGKNDAGLATPLNDYANHLIKEHRWIEGLMIKHRARNLSSPRS